MNAADEKTNGEMQIAFGKIPLEMIATGAIAKLNRSCLLVYLAIAAHINGKSWEATPAIETLVRCTGLHKRSVQRAILKLQDFALITTECGGGRHLRNTYLLATKPARETVASECHPLAAETVASECHPLAAETVAFRHRKGGISAPKRWRPDATHEGIGILGAIVVDDQHGVRIDLDKLGAISDTPARTQVKTNVRREVKRGANVG